MHYADLTRRIAGKSVDTWKVHYRAMERLRRGEDILLLSVGQESDAVTPLRVVDRAVESLRGGRHHYTPVQGERDLRETIAARYRDTRDRAVDAECVSVFAGAQNALFACTQVLLQPRDEVILLEPFYTTYPAAFGCTGAKLVPLALRAEEGFQLDPKRVAAAITANTRAIVVNSPNNPTGAVYSRAALRSLVDLCRDRRIWLISDEVYFDVVEHPDLCSPFGLPGAEEIVISVSSVSKSHRMTGWRVGWAVAPREMASHFYNLNMCMSYGLPGFCQDAAREAILNAAGTPREVSRRIAEQRKTLIEGLSGIRGIRVFGDGGGMFVMANIRALGSSADEFAAGLLESESVSVQPCTGFGNSCKDLIRISAVLDVTRLDEACRRIARYISRLSDGR